ncbi:MAG: MFS transporter [Deltaproteobacteria bacterium]|nr:MAG: MFS transporter [Deltaproteobacteria bacterium]
MTSADAIAALDRALADAIAAARPPAAPLAPDDPLRPGGALTARRAVALFDAQIRSRLCDYAARRLRARGAGYYTIASAGHEGNAAVAAALRPTDPAFVHYRSGAFWFARAAQVPGQRPARDLLLGVVAARDEPIAGGRHKVFGSAALAMPPQTSTIASHLPKAVGCAFAIERDRKLRAAGRVPADAIAVCSFGDASASHSTATGAIAAACRIAMHWPLPILFVCEDNGLGISVPTPPGWIEAAFAGRPGLRYFAGDGCDLESIDAAARAAARYVRSHRRPAFLHMRCVRLLGHAGSDVELAYRSPADIAAGVARDPVAATARLLIETGALSADQVRAAWDAARAEIDAEADRAATAPPLRDAADVMAPLRPPPAGAVAAEAARPVDAAARTAFWGDRLPEDAGPAPMAHHIRAALGDLLATVPELLVFGEDVGRKGGVYGVTRGLQARAGAARVFDTLLDEQTILGLAIGAGHVGYLPVPEIQYLAYLHNAIDQLRGEAATLAFLSQRQFSNPMVVRIAAFADPDGFGGHFHNDNAIAALREIPGLIVAAPSRGDDAAAMLRTCVAAARVDGAVCAFLEPIALYAARDLHAPGDGALAMRYDPAGPHVPIGAPRIEGDGDVLLVSFANGARHCRRVQRRLAEAGGPACRVVDLRWLAPLPVDALAACARDARRVVIADETRRTAGVGEAIVTALVEAGYRGPIARVTAADSFVPLGPAARHVLLSEAAIERAARGDAGR